MSLSNQTRTKRNVELHTREPEIAALYKEQKTDEEIGRILHMDTSLVRIARDGMGLPPLRSASGRLFTPEDDFQIFQLRDGKGKSFREIAQIMGHLEADICVRYRILLRLEHKAESRKPETIPCMVCRQPFVSADRTRVRFCLKCRADEVPLRCATPFDPDSAGGGWRSHAPGSRN